MKKIFFVTFALLFSGAFSAQAHIQNTIFKRLTVARGQASSVVYSIAQDRRGYIWFGGEGGLSKYDGYDIKVYEHDPLKPGSISSNDIGKVIEDTLSGRLFLGTWGGGVNEFDPATESFRVYRHNKNNPNSLSDDRIQSIFIDRDGAAWIGTYANGLNRLDPSRQNITRYPPNPADSTALSNGRVWGSAQDRFGFYWIATDNGLDRLNAKTDKFTVYYHDPADSNSLSHNRVRCLCMDRRGNLWLGTHDGVTQVVMDEAGLPRQFIRYKAGMSNPTVNTIFVDSNDLVWVGTSGGGLNRFNPQTGEWSRFINNPNDPTTISHNDIRWLMEDRSENLWIGTRGGGISILNLRPRKFYTFSHQPANPASLSSGRVFALVQSQNGGMWVGADGGGVSYTPVNLTQVTDFQNIPFFRFQNDPADLRSLSNNRILAMCEDPDSNLWVGTYEGGLNRLRPASMKNGAAQFDHFQHNPDNQNSLSHNRVHSLFVDHSGAIWAGTDSGLNRIVNPSADAAQVEFIHYQNDPKNPNSLSHNGVLSIYQDQQDILWLGTWGGGLNRFDPKTGQFRVYKYNAKDDGTISNDEIFCITEDSYGELWLGTRVGLNKLDRTDGTFTRYYEHDGLPSNEIFGLMEDTHQRLWLTTNKGISRLDLKTTEFHNYDPDDGLQGYEFTHGAVFHGQEGAMFAGGVQGFNIFFPANVEENPYKPAIVLTGFKVFNKDWSFDRDIMTLPRLELSYKQNFLAFEFAALDYTMPEKNQYRYRLDGFDKDWIEAETRRFASYTNLDGGLYTFRVIGSNNDGAWNNEGVSIKLRIIPPPWKTWWAYSLYVAGLVLSVAGYIRYKTVAQQRELQAQARLNIYLEEKVKERTKQLEDAHQLIIKLEREALEQQMAGGFAHEMRNALSGALMMVNSVLKDGRSLCLENAYALGDLYDAIHKELSDETIKQIMVLFEQIEERDGRLDEVIKMVKGAASRAMRVTTLILEYSTLSKGVIGNVPVSVSKLLEGIVNRYRDSFKERQIDLRLDIQTDKPLLGHDSHFETIISNLLQNSRDALADAPKDHDRYTEVKLYEENDTQILVVRDNGHGISEANRKKLFRPFFSTKPSAGTGLGLCFVQKLVQIYDGSIHVESVEGEGASFMIRIPYRAPGAAAESDAEETNLAKDLESLVG